MGKWLPTRDDHRGRWWQIVEWLALNLMMIVPGILLAVSPHIWTTTVILTSVMNMPLWSVISMAIILALGGFAAFRRAWRDIAYVIGALFYAIISLAFIIALMTGVTIGALFVVFPSVAFWFADRSVVASREAEHYDSAEQR